MGLMLIHLHHERSCFGGRRSTTQKHCQRYQRGIRTAVASAQRVWSCIQACTECVCRLFANCPAFISLGGRCGSGKWIHVVHWFQWVWLRCRSILRYTDLEMCHTVQLCEPKPKSLFISSAVFSYCSLHRYVLPTNVVKQFWLQSNFLLPQSAGGMESYWVGGLSTAEVILIPTTCATNGTITILISFRLIHGHRLLSRLQSQPGIDSFLHNRNPQGPYLTALIIIVESSAIIFITAVAAMIPQSGRLPVLILPQICVSYHWSVFVSGANCNFSKRKKKVTSPLLITYRIAAARPDDYTSRLEESLVFNHTRATVSNPNHGNWCFLWPCRHVESMCLHLNIWTQSYLLTNHVYGGDQEGLQWRVSSRNRNLIYGSTVTSAPTDTAGSRGSIILHLLMTHSRSGAFDNGKARFLRAIVSGLFKICSRLVSHLMSKSIL